MHRYQTLLQPSLQTGTMVQKVDVSALATRRNCSFYLFEGMGINSQDASAAARRLHRRRQPRPCPGRRRGAGSGEPAAPPESAGARQISRMAAVPAVDGLAQRVTIGQEASAAVVWAAT